MKTHSELNRLVGSGSIIFDSSGECIRQSHNLRGILEHARGRGVSRIHVDALSDPGRPGALVTVFYRGGDVGKVYFSCGGHALEWAQEQSARNGRVSWFARCEVTSADHAAGAWPWR